MKKAILFKGNVDIITLPTYREKAEKLYDSLKSIFTNLGYEVDVVDSNYGGTLDKALTGYAVVMGHSRGASRIAEWFSEELFPEVKCVILFDPKDIYLAANTHWNDLCLSKVLFASQLRDEQDPADDYRPFEQVVFYQDDHYFNHSLPSIEKQIRALHV